MGNEKLGIQSFFSHGVLAPRERIRDSSRPVHFHQYLLEAAIADGRLPLARALLSERTLTKPNSVGSWSRYATVLDGLGEAEAALEARERGARVKTAA